MGSSQTYKRMYCLNVPPVVPSLLLREEIQGVFCDIFEKYLKYI